MTLADLKLHPAYIALESDQQRQWVLEYCSNGRDKIAATESAYATNTRASAVSTANRNLRIPGIKRVISDYFGMVDETGTRDAFLHLLWEKTQGGGRMDDKTQLGWATLYMKVKGYEAEKPEPADSPVDSVDDLVRQLEAQGKV
jgi:hypothetical protein